MEVIDKLYIDSNIKFETPLDFLLHIIPPGRPYFRMTTYYDKECTRHQCNNLRRSFDDLYVLFKTYFPDITEKEVLKTLESGDVRYYICNDIFKVVFHRTSLAVANIDNFKHWLENYSTNINTYKKEGFTNYTFNDFVRILEEN